MGNLTGNCVCGAPLRVAVVREVRHYEETRLLEVTCGRCEASFFVIDPGTAGTDRLQVEDVAAAAAALQSADRLVDLFGPGFDQAA